MMPQSTGKRFSLVMAVSDDFNGVWMTCQTARLNCPEIVTEGEIIVLDNNPDSEDGKMIADYCKKVGISYIKFTEKKGTSIRDRAIRLASSPVVVCVDSHVLLPGRSLISVVEYLESLPKDGPPIIVSGPMLYDQGNMETHWEPTWGNAMFGKWACDKEALAKGKPFEIPMCGLGAFATLKCHWQGFNDLFHGFGGEEFYIHEKYRQAGGKAVCLPSFVWNHRFQRVSRGYTSYAWQQVRNYVIGWSELGLPVEQMLRHFNDFWSPGVVMEGYIAAMKDMAAAKAGTQATKFLNSLNLPLKPRTATIK